MNRRKFFELVGTTTAGIAFLLVGYNPSSRQKITTTDDGADDMGGYLVPPEYQEQIIEAIQRQDIIRGQGIRVSWVEEEQGNTAEEVLQRRKRYSSFSKWLKSERT